jgi:hypothetical protein
MPLISEEYLGITTRSHPGLHQDPANIILKYVKPGAKVLDMGAEAGAAFVLRHPEQ